VEFPGTRLGPDCCGRFSCADGLQSAVIGCSHAVPFWASDRVVSLVSVAGPQPDTVSEHVWRPMCSWQLCALAPFVRVQCVQRKIVSLMIFTSPLGVNRTTDNQFSFIESILPDRTIQLS
jgi:hypothetical protein